MGEFETWVKKNLQNFFLNKNCLAAYYNYHGVKMKFKRYNYASDVLHFYIYYMYQNAFQNKWTIKVNAFVNAIMINEIIINQYLCLYPTDSSTTLSYMIENKTLRIQYNNLTDILC